MKIVLTIALALFSSLTWSQGFNGRPETDKVDSALLGEQMIQTIEQSLNAFYEDYSYSGNYDSIIDALNYESGAIPKFSDEIYCERLAVINEMSPFQLECNEQTLSTIRFFVEKRRGFARVVLGRSRLYFDMFEEKLSEYDLPMELKYLAVIESGLRPQVKSRAGALGLWQFMYRTGRMFDLDENSYIDERMDPEKATDAACRYLKKLYGIYGDWNLALAAYNAGPGNVNKAIRRSGNKLTYWEVRPFLPKETQGYVPNFIAAAYLLTYHAEHNIIPMEAKVEYNQLDTMCFSRGVHFSSISKLLSIDEEQIKELNPVYKLDYIPKTTPNSCVSLPLQKIGELVGKEESLYALEYGPVTPETPTTNNTEVAIEEEEENNPPVNQGTNANIQYHKVKSGETLGTIASRYGTTVGAIQRLNGFSSTKIYVGQRLKVSGTAAPQATTTPATTNTPAKSYYSVRSGDTFGKIAQRHNMSITQLKKLNSGVNIDKLNVGQKIRVK